jgi:putative ABC transport system permease protein
MMLYLSRHTVRRSWPAYAGAFVAVACGVVLIAVTVTLLGSVDATAGRPGVTAKDRAKLDDLASMFGFMSAVSLFMALFVVGSTFGFVIATRRRELGLLRLVGATPRQVRRMVLGESAVVAAAATLVGCAVAAALAPGAFRLLRTVGITDLHLAQPAPWTAWAVAAPCGAGVALVGCWRSSRRASRVPPTAALREAALERRRPSVVQLLVGSCCLAAVAAAAMLSAQMPPLFALIAAILLPEVVVIGVTCFGSVLFPRLVALLARPFVARDVTARLARDHLGVAVRGTAALAAPVVAISSVAGSMILALSFTADWTTALDRAQLAAPIVVQAAGPGTAATAAADPTVAVVDARRRLSLRLGEDAEDVEAVNIPAAAAARGLRAVRGDLDALHGDTLAVSETWVTDSGAGLGDRVPAIVDSRRATLRIVAIVPDAPDLYGDLLVPEDLVAGELRGVQPDLLFVVPRTGVSGSDAPASLAHALRGTGSQVLTADAWIDGVDAQTRKANNLGLLVLLGPGGLYAGIAIVNATLIGASQRRRQHRLVHLLGATDDQVRRMAVWEAVLVGGAALLIGGLTTGFIGWLVRHATTQDVAHVPMTVPWLPLTAIGGTCVALTVAAAVVGVRVHAAARRRTQRVAAEAV